MRLGVDLDNTLICYDDVFLSGARELNLVPKSWIGDRFQVRAYVRDQKNGETSWQRLQGQVYGRWISRAKLFPGVYRFLWRCNFRKITVDVLSHKSEYGHFDNEEVALRQVARQFLMEQGILSEHGESLINSIEFFSEREEKIERIVGKKFDLFIDDLPEILEHVEIADKTETLGFDPTNTSDFSVSEKVGSWIEIESRLFGKWNDDELNVFAREVSGSPVFGIKWQSGRLNSGVRTKNLSGRRNAGISQVIMADKTVAALKIYPSDPHHDRLFSEFQGLTLIRKKNIKKVPQPIISNAKMNAAMYEWIEGEPVDNPSTHDMEHALDLLDSIHALRNLPEFSSFPSASAAIFSGQQLERQLHERIDMLRDQCVESLPLHEFLIEELEPIAEEVVDWVKVHWPKTENYGEVIEPKKRTLSPSDFGFHNALRKDNSEIIFFDFEYFGWDDPAKLIGDFLLHPGMQLSDDLRHMWIKGTEEIFGETVRKRGQVMWPMLGLCWCLILLNEFRKDVWVRRAEIFGLTSDNKETLLERQLDRSKQYLKKIEYSYRDFRFD